MQWNNLKNRLITSNYNRINMLGHIIGCRSLCTCLIQTIFFR